MILLLIASAAALTADIPPEVKRLTPSLAKVQKFAKDSGASLWPGFHSAPFGFLLIGKNEEFLICQQAKSAAFDPIGKDQSTGCYVLRREKTGLPDTLLAALPILGPPSTIVMGTPETTGQGEAGWTRTILHEHFHQWQNALPDYYTRVDALNLKDGDETGKWMLEFPFPYTEAAPAHATASRALAEALDARGTMKFRQALSSYLTARRAFAEAVGEHNWRYFEFQLWQEGVARWTEIQLGRAFPDKEIRNGALELETRTLAALRAPDLAKSKRVAVYPFGTGEAMLLEACGAQWRKAYPITLSLGPLLQAASENCSLH